MAGLPKKYAKMGFKKGWAAFKASKKKTKSRKNSNSIKYKPKRRMAKKKVKRRSYKRSASILGINTSKALAAMIYGAVRGRTSNAIAPYTSKLPLGNVSDEVGMLGVQYALKKFLFKKAGIGRDVLNNGQAIELARIGEAVSSGSLGINLPFLSGSSGSSSNGYVFN